MDFTSRPPLAGIPARFGAVLLDGLVPMAIAIPAAIVGFLISLGLPNLPSDGMQIFAIFVVLMTCMGFLCYSALVLALWAYGLTPGKWLLGMRVIRFDTKEPARFWRNVLSVPLISVSRMMFFCRLNSARSRRKEDKRVRIFSTTFSLGALNRAPLEGRIAR